MKDGNDIRLLPFGAIWKDNRDFSDLSPALKTCQLTNLEAIPIAVNRSEIDGL